MDNRRSDDVTRGEAAVEQDVQYRFAAARSRDYRFEVRSEEPLEVIVTSDTQPPVVVEPTQSDSWCSCDEDVPPGICTHVLFLAVEEGSVGETVRMELSDTLSETRSEIEELKIALRARTLERDALTEALHLTNLLLEDTRDNSHAPSDE